MPACKKVLRDLSEAAPGEREAKRGMPSPRLMDLPWTELLKGKVCGWIWMITAGRSIPASGCPGKNYQQEGYLEVHLLECVFPPLSPTLCKIYFWRVESARLLPTMLMFRTLIPDITFVGEDTSENLEINELLGFGAYIYIHTRVCVYIYGAHVYIYDSFKVHSCAPSLLFTYITLQYLCFTSFPLLQCKINDKKVLVFHHLYNRSFIPYYFSCFYWLYFYWLVKTKGLISFLNIDTSLWHLGSNCFFFSSINPTPQPEGQAALTNTTRWDFLYSKWTRGKTAFPELIHATNCIFNALSLKGHSNKRNHFSTIYIIYMKS